MSLSAKDRFLHFEDKVGENIVDLNKDAGLVLNQQAIHLYGSEVSFYVHYWGVEPEHYDNPIHKHSFFEICYVVEGVGEYTDQGINHELAKGTLFLSRPGKWHQIRSVTGLFLLYVAFEVEPGKSTAEAIGLYQELALTKTILLYNSDETAAAMLWKSLVTLAGNGKQIYEEALRNLAHSLIISFLQTFLDRTKSSRRHINISKASTTQIHQAKLFIRDNLAQSLQLDDVAGYLHMSGRNLSRLFSDELKQPFTSYIRGQRVKEAARLLTMTTLSIKEIAQETGFVSVHYFTRVFTEAMGAAPGRYRELHNDI